MFHHRHRHDLHRQSIGTSLLKIGLALAAHAVKRGLSKREAGRQALRGDASRSAVPPGGPYGVDASGEESKPT